MRTLAVIREQPDRVSQRRHVATATCGNGARRPGAAQLRLALGRAARVLAVVAALGCGARGAHAARVVVGPGGDFASVEAAINGRIYAPGDVIEIAAGTYEVEAMLRPLGSVTVQHCDIHHCGCLAGPAHNI